MTTHHVYAGTIGQGIWRSEDGGQSFRRCSAGMFIEADVRALAVHPHDPQILFAGTNAGLYQSDNGGDWWQRLPAPFDPGDGWPAGVMIWSILVHPAQPETLFAGTCPAALYRSQDSGATWQKLDAGFETECDALLFNRVTCLRADPRSAGMIWAGAEIGGVRLSRDGGDSWQAVDEGLSSPDIHDLLIVPGDNPLILASTNNDLNLSYDDGATWQRQNVGDKWGQRYCRGLAAKAGDAGTIFLGNGDTVPGTMGTLQMSRNGGATWQAAQLSQPPNSTIWTFATHPADPDLLFCASVLGCVYRSEDGGATWTKCPQEFGEVRTLAWTPA